jgi:hypothetical protein
MKEEKEEHAKERRSRLLTERVIPLRVRISSLPKQYTLKILILFIFFLLICHKIIKKKGKERKSRGLRDDL